MIVSDLIAIEWVHGVTDDKDFTLLSCPIYFLFSLNSVI